MNLKTVHIREVGDNGHLQVFGAGNVLACSSVHNGEFEGINSSWLISAYCEYEGVSLDEERSASFYKSESQESSPTVIHINGYKLFDVPERLMTVLEVAQFIKRLKDFIVTTAEVKREVFV